MKNRKWKFLSLHNITVNLARKWRLEGRAWFSFIGCTPVNTNVNILYCISSTPKWCSVRCTEKMEINVDAVLIENLMFHLMSNSTCSYNPRLKLVFSSLILTSFLKNIRLHASFIVIVLSLESLTCRSCSIFDFDIHTGNACFFYPSTCSNDFSSPKLNCNMPWLQCTKINV